MESLRPKSGKKPLSSLWPKSGKKIELKLDNCPPPFDVTEVGRISIEEVDKGIKTMEKLNGIG